MRQPYPPLDYGGTQRSMVQMTIYQAAICAHEITLYGPAESTIINYSAEFAKKLGLDIAINQKGDTIKIKNADGRIGSITLRTTGHNATGYGNLDEKKLNEQLFELLVEDEKKSPYDIIHSHFKDHTVMTLIPAGLGYKTLTHNHNVRLFGYEQYKYPVICISYSQARNLKKRYGALVYEVIHHGLDPFTYYATTDHAGYLTWIGRFVRDKGADVAIKIARKVKKPLILAGTIYSSNNISKEYFDNEIKPFINISDPSFLDRIFGMTPDQIKQEIEQIAGRTGASAPVILAGPGNEIQKQTLFGNAMGTLFPVKWQEPFGRVMIESMACGTPVIGYVKVGSIQCGAVEEVIEDGVTGFHVKAENDEDAINKAVEAVLRLPEINRKRVREVFDSDWNSERMARQIDATYKRCLGEPVTILSGRPR